MAFPPGSRIPSPQGGLLLFGRLRNPGTIQGLGTEGKEFVDSMYRIMKSGFDFEAGSREAVIGKFGGAADVILRSLTPEALREPRLFAEEMSGTFGKGSLGILEPIVRYANEGRFPRMNRTKSAAELLREIGPSGEAVNQLKNPLHDQRITDELENQADEVD